MRHGWILRHLRRMHHERGWVVPYVSCQERAGSQERPNINVFVCTDRSTEYPQTDLRCTGQL